MKQADFVTLVCSNALHRKSPASKCAVPIFTSFERSTTSWFLDKFHKGAVQNMPTEQNKIDIGGAYPRTGARQNPFRTSLLTIYWASVIWVRSDGQNPPLQQFPRRWPANETELLHLQTTEQLLSSTNPLHPAIKKSNSYFLLFIHYCI